MQEINRREFFSLVAKVATGFTAWEIQERISSLERLVRPWFYTMVEADTLNIRSLPDRNSPICSQVKKGAILRVENKIIKGNDGFWYKIIQNPDLRWPPKTEEYIWAEGLKEITDLSPINPSLLLLLKK